jgi:CheY-like chemotaxis protein
MATQVLMLDGDSDDRYITSETLLQLGLDIDIRFFSGSREFFNYLSTSGRPALILIDYNSEPENGIEVLKKLKEHVGFSEIPVVILSDSDHPRYKDECYRCGASSFIKKPDTVEATNKKIAAFFRYWLDVVEI